jgi:hypothetical protein
VPQCIQPLEQFFWECLAHPSFSLAFASSNFHLIRPLKNHFERKHFQCDDEVKAEMCWWVQTLSSDFFSGGTSVGEVSQLLWQLCGEMRVFSLIMVVLDI